MDFKWHLKVLWHAVQTDRVKWHIQGAHFLAWGLDCNDWVVYSLDWFCRSSGSHMTPLKAIVRATISERSTGQRSSSPLRTNWRLHWHHVMPIRGLWALRVPSLRRLDCSLNSSTQSPIISNTCTNILMGIVAYAALGSRVPLTSALSALPQVWLNASYLNKMSLFHVDQWLIRDEWVFTMLIIILLSYTIFHDLDMSRIQL